MKNVFVILLILVALGAVAAGGLLLFSGPSPEEPLLEPLEQPPVGAAPAGEEPPEAPFVPPAPAASGEKKRLEIEDIKPATVWTWKPADVALRAVDLKSLKPAADDTAQWRVFRGDVLLPLQPRPADKRGALSFGALMPGRYRFEVDFDDGRQGRLTLDVQPELAYDEDVYVGIPASLELTVVRAGTGTGIAGALIDAPGLVARGETDADGVFRSKRPVVPDASLEVKVSRTGYLTTLFQPFGREAVRGSKGAEARVALHPLTGATHLSGTISDPEGGPLGGFVLRLFPAGTGAGEGERFYETSTTHTGQFTFKNLPPGTYSLEGMLRHWIAPSMTRLPPLIRETITVEEGESREGLNIVCSVAKIHISGIVLHSAALAPLPGVRVAWNGASAGSVYERLYFEEAVTGADGLFTIARAYDPADVQTLLTSQGLLLTAPGLPETVFRLPQSPDSIAMAVGGLMQGEPLRVWVHGPDDVELHGTVVDFNGEPLSRIQVSARPLTHPGTTIRALTTLKGDFRIPSLHAGDWEVQAILASPPSYPVGPALRRVITVAAGAAPEPLRLQAEGSGRIEGTADLSAAPYFPQISVRGEGFALENVRLRQSGNFTFEHLPPGEAEIIVESYTDQQLDESTLRIRKGRAVISNGQTATVEL